MHRFDRIPSLFHGSNALRSTLVAAVIIAFPGCSGSAFPGAVPEASSIMMQFPQASSAARPAPQGDGSGSADDDFPESDSVDEADEDPAQCYVHAQKLTSRVNNHVDRVMGKLANVLSEDPTQIDGNTWLYGPKHNDEQNIERQVLVTFGQDGAYHYRFQGAPAGTSDFVDVTVGDVDAGSTETTGSGRFTRDLDAVHALIPDKNVGGTVDYAYVIDQNGARTIGVVMTDFLFNDGTISSGTIDYAGQGDSSGSMHLVRQKDVYGDTATPEDTDYQAKWLPSQAGRCDGLSTNGDLSTSQLTVAQCWDSTTLETYYLKALDGTTETARGDAAQCPF